MKPLPFNVVTEFKAFALLLYSVDLVSAKKLIEDPFILKEHKGRGIMATAFAKVKHLRPAFLPSFLGVNFDFAGFRFMVDYHSNSKNKDLSGLKILRSVSNNKLLSAGGKIFSQYNFSYSNLEINQSQISTTIKGELFDIELQHSSDKRFIQAGSLFSDYSEARKFAGPLLYTFERKAHKISIVEGSREHWQPRPAKIIAHRNDFFAELPFSKLDAIPEAAFTINDIPYSWQKAITETFIK